MTNKEFKKALKQVYDFDIKYIVKPDPKVFRGYTKRYLRQESKRAKHDQKLISDLLRQDLDIDDAPAIMLLQEIKSAEVLKNIICRTMKGDTAT